MSKFTETLELDVDLGMSLLQTLYADAPPAGVYSGGLLQIPKVGDDFGFKSTDWCPDSASASSIRLNQAVPIVIGGLGTMLVRNRHDQVLLVFPVFGYIGTTPYSPQAAVDNIIASDANLDSIFARPLITEASATLGALSYGEMYGYSLLPSLGGSMGVENLKKVSAAPYIALLSQSVPIEFDDSE